MEKVPIVYVHDSKRRNKDGYYIVYIIRHKQNERLMDFDDGWTEVPGCIDSKRYKALGNSIVVSCMEYVLRGITYFLSQQKAGD